MLVNDTNTTESPVARQKKMSRFSRAPSDCKVYVGDLPKDASEKELDRAFSYYGHLKNVWVARNPPGFAFVEFEDYRDAEDAVKGLDGTTICGSRCRVELSSGKARPKPWLRGGGGGGGRGPSRGGRRTFNSDDKCYECGERGHYAYDCSKVRRSSGGSRRRSRSASRSHSRSRSRGRYESRSPQAKPRSRSPSQN